MRAVWSFWSLPYRAHSGWRWLSERHHLYSWVLSVECARSHFDERILCTDDDGATLLVDGIGLPFTEVLTDLNRLQDQDPDWWILGKLHSYHLQRQSFVHLDSDVYLWKPLPERVKTAAALAQNPEDGRSSPWYDADLCESVIRSRGDSCIPVEWAWYRHRVNPQIAACCGIVGGNDLELLQYYASTVIRILESRRNRTAFSGLADKKALNPFFEQYLLCACAAFRGIKVEYLFDSYQSAIEPGRAAEAGYTHLISAAKSNPAIGDRLEQRVAADYPESYERCNQLAGWAGCYSKR